MDGTIPELETMSRAGRLVNICLGVWGVWGSGPWGPSSYFLRG
jgi:hypothetical protein